MKRHAHITALCAAVGILASRVVVASNASPVLVAYTAPSECPSAEAFRQQLQRRLATSVPVDLVSTTRSGANAILVKVDVEASAGSFLAQLSLRDPSGQSSPRRLTGPKCADLIEALAFTAALSVEQAQESHTVVTSAATRLDGGERAAASTGAAGDAPAGTKPTAATRPHPSEPAQERKPATTVDPTQPQEPPVQYEHTRDRLDPGFMTWSSQASAGLTLTSPLDTSLHPGLTIGVQFNARSATGWSPALGLSVQGSIEPLQVTDERASFRFLTGQAYVCPGALHPEDWTIRLCGLVQVGTLNGRGENLEFTHTINTRVSSAGLMLSVNYALSSELFLGAQAGALLAIDHNRFEIGEHRRVVAETRAVAPWLALEVGTTL